MTLSVTVPDSRGKPVPGRPRASVVVPAYGRPEPLRLLLDSLVVDIGGNEIEVVVSDDGSGPEIAEVARSYSGSLCVTYVRGENAGPGVARNRGVKAASADVLLFVDSDCFVKPGWSNALTSAIEAGAQVAYGPTRSAVPALEPFVHSFVLDGMVTANLAFARATFEGLCGFREDISRFAEDRDLFARADAAGIVPVNVPEAVVVHPPRLKKIAPELLWGNPSFFRDLRAFYASYPSVRAADLRKNRRNLTRGTLKLLVGMTPLGLTTFVAHALRRRRIVNRQLAAAGVDLRVPAGDAIKYGLLQPVNDLLRWATVAAQLKGF